MEVPSPTWLTTPAVIIPPEITPQNAAAVQQITISSVIEHYKACRRAHITAKLLGTVTFYQIKRFRLYTEPGYSSYQQWADDFKKSPSNPELRSSDMEWLARAGAVVSFLLSLDTLPVSKEDDQQITCKQHRKGGC
jgi:hypothetical protein